MDAKTAETIRKNPEFDAAITALLELWDELSDDSYGTIGVTVKYKSGRVNSVNVFRDQLFKPQDFS